MVEEIGGPGSLWLVAWKSSEWEQELTGLLM